MSLLDIIKQRYSARLYSAQPIEAEKLAYLMECVRLAPSACNRQPWRFRVVTDREQLDALCACYGRDWIQSAPCIVVACGDHEEVWKRGCDGKHHVDVDISIAVEHLCLAATEQGLATCWVCNFDVEACRQTLALPAALEPIALIPLGYAADEPKEKKRKTLEEITF